MKIDIGKTVSVLVSVKENKECRVYEVEYDRDTNILRKITYLAGERKAEVGAVILKEMLEIVKTMNLEFPGGDK
jgi:hypothetical protein